MAVKFETVKAGDTLWDYHSERAGNTMVRRWGNWPVIVKEINHAERWALVSWNGNPVRRVSSFYFKTLRRTPGKTDG